MRSTNTILLSSLLSLTLGMSATTHAGLFTELAEMDIHFLSAQESCTESSCEASTCCSCTPASIVPNMIGGESLGIPYDNGTLEARLTYQHFLRVADNNSPIPRDRVAFGYRSYNRAQVVEGGDNDVGPDQELDIQEFHVRMEKTLYDGLMSVEAILPWAYTTDSTQPDTISTPQLNSELGNIGLGLKGVLWEDGKNFWTAGLLVELPTADDRRRATGRTLDEEVWHFTPYLAFLLQPTEKLYVQGFGGTRLSHRDTRESGNGRNLNSPDLFTLDIGTGYRLHENSEGLIRAITPTMELHYTSSFDRVHQTNENGYYSALGGVDFLTLTAGSTVQVRENTTVTAGFAFPLRTNHFSDGDRFIGPTDRQFDWSFILQVNLFRL